MNEETYTLDRVEEGVAVLLPPGGGQLTVPAALLAQDARQGMLLRWDEASGCYCPDPAATSRRQAELRARVAALLGKSGGQP